MSSTLFGSSSATSSQNALGDLSKDVAVVNPPEDSISDIAFSTQTQHLAVASWDKKVRIYEISASGGSEGKAFFDHEGPVLSCHWSKVCNVHVKGSQESVY
jgi:mRNA export factor